MAQTATQVTTGEVRISYEHLTQAHASQPGAEPKFSATLLIPKSDTATKQAMTQAIDAAIQQGISAKWGGTRPPVIGIPLYDGDGVRPNGEPFGPECKGHWVITAGTKQRPEIVDTNMQAIIQPSEIYSGMYARVNVNFFPYFQAGKKGVGCGLGPVMKLRDGEALGGRVSAAEAFGGTSQPQPYYPPQQQAAGLPWETPAGIDPLTGRPYGVQ